MILPTIAWVTKKQELTGSGPSPIVLKVDVSNIAGATGAVIQISNKNVSFAKPNSSELGKDSTEKLIDLHGTSGTIELKYSDLNGDGQYQIRCLAINKQGQPLGVCSDHLNIVAQQ